MARRSKDEIMEGLKNLLGDNTSDEALAFTEDLSDTLTTDGKDWKTEYENNDARWRQKYRDRFFGAQSSDADNTDDLDVPAEKKTPVTFDDLFKEE